MPPSLEDTIAILSEIWNTNAAIPGNEYVLERIHAYVKTHLPQSIKNYQNAQSERETRKKSLALTADEITETFLNKTKYFYCAASELYFTYNNQVRYSLIHEDEIHHRILSFTSCTSGANGASVLISAPVSEASCTSGANGASVLISAPVSEASGANGASASSSVASYGGATASANGGAVGGAVGGATASANGGAVGGADIISASANGGASASTSETNRTSNRTSVSTSIRTSIKYKIKNKIIKSIQSRDILSSIPESHTIQNVIAMLCPALFSTRDHAKYFLTILGDILLKKSASSSSSSSSSSSLVYFIPPVAKELIKDLGSECYSLFGSGSSAFTTVFKFKYYEHQYKDCRIVDIHAGAMGGGGVNASFITPTTGALFRSSCLRLSHMPDLKSAVIDVCCVAAHYSHRFGSADDFLRLHCKTPEVVTHALYLRDRTDPQIIQEFIDYATEPASADHEISMTNMLYLWKMYLSEFRLPAMFFAATLRAKLAEYACAAGVGGGGDAFLHRTSRYLPVVSQFRQFWGEHCVVNDTEIELEIDELSTLFKDYAATATPAGTAVSASDATLLGILRHFYPDVAIEDDKYILNVGCALWNKNAEIDEILVQFRDQCLAMNLSFPQPLYNAYEYYCGRCYSAAKRRIISKRYFEKYFSEEYAEYLDENGMITMTWWAPGDEGDYDAPDATL